MSCSLLYKNYFLEYDTGFSSFSKIIYSIIFLCGISLFSYEIYIENDLKDCIKPTSLSIMLRLLQIISVIITITPILFFIFSNGKKFTKNMVFLGASILILGAMAVTGLVAGINIEYAKCKNKSLSLYIWIPTILLLIFSLWLMYYKYKTANNIILEKQTTDWTDVKSNGLLIEKIGKNQVESCGQTYTSGQAFDAMRYHIAKENEKYKKNTNAFTRLFNKQQLLPSDKIPNIPRMMVDYSNYIKEEAERKEEAKRNPPAQSQSYFDMAKSYFTK